MICVGGRGALYGEVWYDEVAPRDARVDIMVFRQRQSPEPAGSSALRSSLVTDLSIPAEQLMHRFGSDCRYKIRRADARDRLQMEFIAEPGQRLEDFRRFFDAFAAQRTLAPCDQRWLTAACKARQLVLAVASRDGEHKLPRLAGGGQPALIAGCERPLGGERIEKSPEVLESLPGLGDELHLQPVSRVGAPDLVAAIAAKSMHELLRRNGQVRDERGAQGAGSRRFW